VTAHLVEAGGKRLRPMLTLATARMCGYNGPHHLNLAARWSSFTPRRCCTTTWSMKASGAGPADGEPAVGQQVLGAGRRLSVRTFVPVDGGTGSLRVLDILSNAAATIAEGEVLQLTAAP
jgi:octaprenyl-diphosphate synthase